ncbi:MAG: metal ABC transporter substrate-binding protein [Longimonas sp.]|uniref:metal ABC transporter substrate-binding protein n=1 Tax=Longimonas sp. TaxID=2039626 RepID=UPI003974EB63
MTRTRWIAYVVASVWMIGLAGGCESEPDSAALSASAQPHYVVTLPVLASIVEPVVEDRATTRTVLRAGDSPHTFEPRPSMVRDVRESHALLYGADVLDGWAAQMDAPRAYALLDLVPESHVHSFPDEEEPAEESPGAVTDEGAHDHGAGTTDPHFWLDPVAVRALVPALADTLCTADPEGCDTYQTNAQALTDSLQALHDELETVLAPVRDRAFMASQPFLHYFVRRYGLSQVAVVETSPAHEPSAQRIHQLTQRAQADHVRAMVYQRQLPATAGQAVAEGAGLPMVALDPLAGSDTDTYMALMRRNAYTLREALEE